MKQNIWFLFFVIAVIGLICALTAHIMSLLGEPLPYGTMVLHIGIFVVWVPFLIRAKRNNPGVKQLQIKAIFKYAPVWMKVVSAACWVYGFVSFFIYSNQVPRGTSLPQDAMLVLFSGGWIAFYGVAAGGLYPEQESVEENT